jgi:nucleoside triphosphate pyrophosphatase
MSTDFIYLASASPRRRELLAQIGVEFVVRPAEIPEAPLGGEVAAAYVERMARAKAGAVWARVAEDAPRPVLAADTAVVVGTEILGKPRDSATALAMLARLSGRTHEVLSAIAVRFEDRTETSICASKVRFRATTAAERAAYCATSEPLDKAGAYGIQGCGAVFIADLQGSYSGVMGLPVFETAALLGRFGLPVWLHGEVR